MSLLGTRMSLCVSRMLLRRLRMLFFRELTMALMESKMSLRGL